MFNQFAGYEDAFRQWRQDGLPKLKPDSYRYIESLTSHDDDRTAKDGTLWQHQWESFLRVVYTHEILGRTKIGADGLLLNIATGGGKTAVIAAVTAWLRIAYDVQKFVMLCPNLIVRDRLEEDFKGGKVFRERGLLPDWAHCRPDDFALTTLGGGRQGGWSSLFGANVIVGNIHQFYQSNRSGQSNLSGLMNGPEFALFNDEAHNSPAPEYEETLKLMRKKVVLRVDTTATPDRADGKTPDSDMIFEYGVTDALADGIVKSPVVYQPDIKTVQLTYTDARSGERKNVEEIDWDEVDRLGLNATQWVTDDEPMRQQIAISLRRLEEQQRRAKRRYQPILFVVAVCKADAEKAQQTLSKYFKVKTLLVTEDSGEVERQKASELGRQQKAGTPYKAVVSVLMLREGWDVPEVGVILILRKFGSKVYGQQVVGRGLRRIRAKRVAPDEPQICALVDHPKLEHEWLWAIFNAKKRTDVSIEDEFEELEDLPEPPPKQELKKPHLVIDVPPIDPSATDDGEFDLGDDIPQPPTPLETWRDTLARIEYDPTTAEITRVDIDSVTGRELSGDRWKTIYSESENTAGEGILELKIADESLRDTVKDNLLEIAAELTVAAGYSEMFKDRVYSALLQHVRTNFLNGLSLGLAERSKIELTWKMLWKVKEQVKEIPGLVAGIIEYGD